MSNSLVLHDIHNIEDIVGSCNNEDFSYFDANANIKPCIGCFDCWVKTPGKCIIKDKAYKLPKLISECYRMVIISENYYGGYSPAVKCAMDRSIGYLLPFFRILNNEMHHAKRYNHPFFMEAHFYGKRITEQEKELAEDILKANAVNLGATVSGVHFYNSADEIKGIKL